LMGFSLLPANLGDRIAILSVPGGLAVAAAEACGQVGLRLAELSQESRSALAGFVPPTGTSLRNPVDVGLGAALDTEIYVRAARTIAADPGVDAVVVIGRGMNEESNRFFAKSMIQAHENHGKPFVVVGTPGFNEGFADGFFQAGVPFFETAERAMSVYAQVRLYQVWCEKRDAPI